MAPGSGRSGKERLRAPDVPLRSLKIRGGQTGWQENSGLGRGDAGGQSSWGSGNTTAGAARGGVSGRGVGGEIGQRGRGAGRQRRRRLGQNVKIENPPHQVRPLPVSRLLGRMRLLRVARILGGGGAGDVGGRGGWAGAGLFRGGGQAFAG